MLCKQAATYGLQWDKFLSGIVWAYRNTPYEKPQEKSPHSYYLVQIAIHQLKQH